MIRLIVDKNMINDKAIKLASSVNNNFTPKNNNNTHTRTTANFATFQKQSPTNATHSQDWPIISPSDVPQKKQQ